METADIRRGLASLAGLEARKLGLLGSRLCLEQGSPLASPLAKGVFSPAAGGRGTESRDAALRAQIRSVNSVDTRSCSDSKSAAVAAEVPISQILWAGPSSSPPGGWVGADVIFCRDIPKREQSESTISKRCCRLPEDIHCEKLPR